jgi:PA14 domain/Concanavalin A-like lectin/glucanases superfamily
MCKKSIFLSASVLLLAVVLSDVSYGGDPNLVGWWRFNDGSGTVAIDSSGNDHHGVLVDNPVWVSGVFGGALQFAGGNHVAVPGYDGILGTQSRTSAAWVNVTKTNASIITWGPAGGGTKWVMRTHNGPAVLRLECGQGNTWGTTDLADGQWHHVAAVLDNDGTPDISEVKLYVDGKLDPIAGGKAQAINTSSGTELQIAYDLNNTGRVFDGMMDDVRIYNRALSESEIQAIMNNPGRVTQALAPDPNNGSIIDTTWYALGWTPGDLAVSHQVYIGENFDDVNDGEVEPISSESPFLFVGFDEPFPAGLTPGATYYWRVDEVNEAKPDSPWRGKVWSFSVRPKTAWKPVPADGARFVDPNTKLSWDPGVGQAVFYVYFGDTFEDVNSAEGASFITATTYDPGPLEPGKTYYWRVDGSDFKTTQRGKVWSFTTATPGGGLIGEYFNNMTLSGQPVLTRTDPKVDFDYGAGSPEEGVVPDDGFSVRWRGEIEAAFSEPYTFYTRTDDGSRLWVNDQLVVDKWAWVNIVVDTRGTPIRLEAGKRYSIRMEYYNQDKDAQAHLFWESPSQPKAIIPQAAFSLPVSADSPSPANGATDVKMTPVLRWAPGIYAASHEVYFGTDANAVANATKTSPEYKTSQAAGSESYDPGKLAWHTTYYWRVDEVNSVRPESPWKGRLWSFTTGDFIVVDDFEDYDVGDNQIWYAWHDGLGYGTPATPPYFAGNGTGSAVGDETTPSYTEETIVHGGHKSMPFTYDNNKQGFANYSQAELTLTAPRDWTEEGVAELSLWFRGAAGNAAEPLYVALSNATGQAAVVYNDDPNAATIQSWTEWAIPLQEFADQGIDLTNVDKMAIGLGTRGNATTPGGAGKMYFDDIRLYRPQTAP